MRFMAPRHVAAAAIIKTTRTSTTTTTKTITANAEPDRYHRVMWFLIRRLLLRVSCSISANLSRWPSGCRGK